MRRRGFLAGAGLLFPALRADPARAAGVPGAESPAAAAGASIAQSVMPDPLTDFLTLGAPVRRGRVDLQLPVLIENGNSVPMKVTVESPMTENDHVKVIHLLSERNPVRQIASFHLGPRAGRAEVQSRIRLAGSQRVIALAQMSDGSFWSDTRATVVTLSACVDESGAT